MGNVGRAIKLGSCCKWKVINTTLNTVCSVGFTIYSCWLYLSKAPSQKFDRVLNKLIVFNLRSISCRWKSNQMHLLFLHLRTICCLQLLLFSYLQNYQKLVYKHIFCTNFHYSLIPDTSNAQISQSETPQMPSPNLIVSTPVAHTSSSQEISIDPETIQQHVYNFNGPYPYDSP